MGGMEIDKARLSQQGARLCFEGRCYDSSASRSYYAMFQATQVALDRAGFGRLEWTHAGLQASFASQLTQYNSTQIDDQLGHSDITVKIVAYPG